MEIHKILTLSTGHLTREEFENLESDIDMPYRAIKHEYGCIIVISEDLIDEMPDVPENLKNIIEYCIRNVIRYVDFDQDAPISVNRFPVFSW